MIIIVHSLYFIVHHFWKIYRTAKAIRQFQWHKLIQEDIAKDSNCLRTDSLDLRFNPPLYQQRYVAVQQILLNENWKSRIKKVVDFGCSELNFFKYLKHLHDINEIICVDIDQEVLEDNLFKAKPLTVDYLNRRPSPLKVYVLTGSVSQPDARACGVDAVVAIELIEHLYPDTLEALPYNVFHYIKPFLAIFTTPNYEFNALFPDKKKYRHPDHKFEWTREQFRSWALNIVMRFPNYTVQFDGIGPGPEGSESYGCCSQMAIFLKHSEDEEKLFEVPRSCREILTKQDIQVENLIESQGICTYYSYVTQIQNYDAAVHRTNNLCYKKIDVIEYPYHVDNRSPRERMLDEVHYKLYSASTTSRFYNEENERIEYPLSELVENEEGPLMTVSELRKLLEKENFELKECLVSNTSTKSLCVVHYLSMENRSSTPGSDGNNSEDKGVNWNLAAEESDWEAEYNQSVKINNEVVGNSEQKPEETKVKTDSNPTTEEPKMTLQFHSTLANTSQSIETKDEVKRDRNSNKRQTSSHSKLPTPSASHSIDKTPKKGTNVKNKDFHASPQSTSRESESKKRKSDSTTNNSNDNNDKKYYKKSIELKVHDSSHSQGSSIKNNRTPKTSPSSNIKPSPKGKVVTTSSLKRFPIKIEDTSLPSTSDLKKKKKGKKSDEDKEDIKALTECIIYNTLNNIPEVDENHPDSLSNENLKIKLPECISEITTPVPSNVEISNDTIGHEIIEQILRNAEALLGPHRNRSDNDEKRCKESTSESTNQELNHASREALFDPNSETDMLEEFEIPPPPLPPIPQAPTADHRNVILIGLTQTNEEETVVLPDNADPFPNWLLQLLGANVEEGESHDEPHFYCQGDGIGVHPSIIEVEIDEEESTSDSSSSHHEAEAGYTSSDSGVVQLPTDDMEERNLQDDNATDIPLNRATPGSTSAADSTDEFFDSLEETLTINSRSNSQNRRN